jgi:CHAD domain-containing protein
MHALEKHARFHITALQRLIGMLPEPEAIHDMRVSVKNLRALMAFVYPAKMRGKSPIDRQLAGLYKAGGRLRDHDHLIQRCMEYPGSRHPLTRRLKSLRPDLEHALMREVREFDLPGFRMATAEFIAALPHEDHTREHALQFVRKQLRRGRNTLRRSRKRKSALHDARRLIKQNMLLLAVWYPKNTLKAWKDLEQTLGDWHDKVLWHAHIEQHETGIASNEASIISQEEKRQLKAETRLLRRRVLDFRWEPPINNQNASPKAI